MGNKVSDEVKKQEAQRLAALFENIGIDGKGYAPFAKKNKIPGDRSIINQHLTGTRPISIDAVLAYAKAFGCSIGEISPRLAKKLNFNPAERQKQVSELRNPLILELIEIANKISDVGLGELIGRAMDIAERRPKAVKKSKRP